MSLKYFNKKKIINFLILILGLFIIGFARFYYLTHTSIDAAHQASIDGEEVENVDTTSNSNSYFQLENIVLLLADETNQEEILLFQQEDECFFFMPSYATQRTKSLEFDENEYLITISGKQISNGETLDFISPNEEYEMVVSKLSPENVQSTDSHMTLCFMQSQNLKTLFITTKSGGLDYIHENKENKEPGTYLIVEENGIISYDGELESFSGRGNTSWDGPSKKPYKLELAQAEDFLNSGKSEQWVLLTNAIDGSFLRNKIALDLAKELDVNFAVETEFIDLYVNNEYLGNYLLCEKIEVGENRVDIGDSQIFFEVNHYEDEPVVKINDFAYTIHYPEEASSADKESLYHIMESVENSIYSADGIDWITGESYEELIDIDSWAKKYLLDWITKTSDTWFGSNFLYTGEDGKVYCGPAWDFDRGFGNIVYKGSNETILQPQGYLNDPYGWCPNLDEKDGIAEEIHNLFNELAMPYLLELVESELDVYKNLLDSSVTMDFKRWGTDMHYLSYESFEMQVEFLKDYIEKRVIYTDEIWNQDIEYYEVSFVDDNETYTYYVKHGTCIEAPDVMITENFNGWYDLEGNAFIEIYPIYGNDVYYVDYYEKSESNESAESVIITIGDFMAAIFFLFLVTLPICIILLVSGQYKKINLQLNTVSSLIRIFIHLGIVIITELLVIYLLFRHYVSDMDDKRFYYIPRDAIFMLKCIVIIVALIILLGIVERKLLWYHQKITTMKMKDE
ncbi:MAG: CotH kinase family protein [Eubacteriales bacterium]